MMMEKAVDDDGQEDGDDDGTMAVRYGRRSDDDGDGTVIRQSVVDVVRLRSGTGWCGVR